MSESINYEAIRYPMEIVAKKNSKKKDTRVDYKTLCVESLFSPPAVNEGDCPLSGFDSKFSRYKISIIHKTEVNGKATGVSYPTANIRVDEMAGIKAKSDAAMQMEMFLQSNYAKNNKSLLTKLSSDHDKMVKMLGKIGKMLKATLSYYKTGEVPEIKDTPAKETGSSVNVAQLKEIANSVTFQFGSLTGKKPLQVLLENAEKGKGILEKQRDFAAKNLAQYPKNQEQIDAIDAALQLLAAGALKDGDAEDDDTISGDNGIVEIYTATPRTLVRKKNEETGLCPVYEFSINWHYGEKYPIEVTIVNEDAPVNIKEGGQINPILSQKQNVVRESFYMSVDDWYDVLDAMVHVKQNFRMLHYKNNLKVAEEANRQAIAKNKDNA